MKPTIKGIKNAEWLVSIFGGWPSFHDAEIHSILITRDCDAGPQIEITVHHWEMTNHLDFNGYFILRHHTLSTLRFSEVSDLQLANFNHQNVLFDLEISEFSPETGFSVSLPSSYGCETAFKCREICVLTTKPFPQS